MFVIANLHDRLMNFGPARSLLYPLIAEGELLEIQPRAASLEAKLTHVLGKLRNSVRYQGKSPEMLVFIVELAKGNTQNKDIQYNRCLAHIRKRIQEVVLKTLSDQHIVFDRCYVLAVDSTLHDRMHEWPDDEKARIRWQLDTWGFTNARYAEEGMLSESALTCIKAAWSVPDLEDLEKPNTRFKDLKSAQQDELLVHKQELLAAVETIRKEYEASCNRIDQEKNRSRQESNCRGNGWSNGSGERGSTTHFLDRGTVSTIITTMEDTIDTVFDSTYAEILQFDPVMEFATIIQHTLSIFVESEEELLPILRFQTPPDSRDALTVLKIVFLLVSLYESRIHIKVDTSISRVEVNLDSDIADVYLHYYSRLRIMEGQIGAELGSTRTYELSRREQSSLPTFERPKLDDFSPERWRMEFTHSEDVDQNRWIDWMTDLKSQIEETEKTVLRALESCHEDSEIPEPTSALYRIDDPEKELFSRREKMQRYRKDFMRAIKPWHYANRLNDKEYEDFKTQAIKLASALPNNAAAAGTATLIALVYLIVFSPSAFHGIAHTAINPDMGFAGTVLSNLWIIAFPVAALIGRTCIHFARRKLLVKMNALSEEVYSIFHDTRENILRAFDEQAKHLEQYMLAAMATRDLDDFTRELKKGSLMSHQLKHHLNSTRYHKNHASMLYRDITGSEIVDADLETSALQSIDIPETSKSEELNPQYFVASSDESETFTYLINNMGASKPISSETLRGLKEITILEDTIYRNGLPKI